MWVRNAWYVAGWLSEIEPGAIHARTIIDQPLVLYRTADGGMAALEDRCCHRFAPLSMGRLEGDDLRCMYHGLKFAPDGRCIEIPGQKLIPQSACVRRYPVAVRGSWVWIWMGDAAAADPAAIPPSLALDDPAYRLQAGHLDYAAHYLLIDDNLLDLSHLCFAHEKTLGLDMPQWADERPRMLPLERGLRFQRWLANHAPRGFMKKTRRAGRRVEHLRLRVSRRLPAAHQLLSGGHRRAERRSRTRGAAAVPSHRRAGGDAGLGAHLALFLCRRRACQRHRGRQARAAVRRDPTAFHEDKRIIEAQQKLIDLDPTEPCCRPASMPARPGSGSWSTTCWPRTALRPLGVRSA